MKNTVHLICYVNDILKLYNRKVQLYAIIRATIKTQGFVNIEKKKIQQANTNQGKGDTTVMPDRLFKITLLLVIDRGRYIIIKYSTK